MSCIPTKLNGYSSSCNINLCDIILLIKLWKWPIYKDESHNYMKNDTHLKQIVALICEYNSLHIRNLRGSNLLSIYKEGSYGYTYNTSIKEIYMILFYLICDVQIVQLLIS